MLRYWLWLTTRKGLGASGRKLVLQSFASPQEAFLADETRLRGIGVMSDREITALMDKDMSAPDQILRDCDKKRISILTWQDALYPNRMRNIENPPLVLFYEGTLPAFDAEPTVAVVGSRKASAYGLRYAKIFGYQLGRCGMIVVSGGARGIDSLGLEGALTSGRPVVAVLGCGTDYVYPAENRHLFEDIRRNGCLISEYPPGTLPTPDHFPARNRILSGLSLGVLVVEAPARSGALITARLALEQGKDVFTIPGNLGVESLAGNIHLMKDGAIVAEDGWDIASEYTELFPQLVEQYRVSTPASEGTEPPREAAKESANEIIAALIDKKSVDIPKKPQYIDITEILKTAHPDEAAILKLLADGPMHVDDLIEKSQITTPRILSAVTMLEIGGYIKRLPARRFALAEKK